MAAFNWIYVIISAVISLFYGLFAVIIFVDKDYYQKLPLTKKIREAIFNFSGAAVGFILSYYLIRKAMFSVIEKQYDLMNLTDILLLIIAIMGIFGLLPWTMHIVAGKIAEILGSKKKD